MKIQKIFTILCLLLITFGLTTCGQKGDLVRPQPEEQQEK